jgi:hypothetical protein
MPADNRDSDGGELAKRQVHRAGGSVMRDFIAVKSPRDSYMHARILVFLAVFFGLFSVALMVLPN